VTAKRRVQYVLVCEDQQHESFVRRFLKRSKRLRHNDTIRVERAPFGRGAADRFVLDTFVEELRRGRISHVDRTLLVMVDGDKWGLAGRMRQLNDECDAQGVPARTDADRVAIFIPTWKIETWFAYLDGQDVQEDRKDYPKLAEPSQCQRHVDRLVRMCTAGRLSEPAPDTLHVACKEYNTTLP